MHMQTAMIELYMYMYVPFLLKNTQPPTLLLSINFPWSIFIGYTVFGRAKYNDTLHTSITKDIK